MPGMVKGSGFGATQLLVLEAMRDRLGRGFHRPIDVFNAVEAHHPSKVEAKAIYSTLRALADRGNLKRKEGKNRLDVKYKYVTDSKEWPETGGKKAPERPRGARSISVEHANEALASPPVALVRATGLPPLPPDGRRVLITHDDLADGTHIEIIAEELPDVMERFRLEGRKNVEVWSRASLRVTLE
jgi:hypothetical protein